MTVAARQIAIRNLGIADKILTMPAYDADELFLDKYPGVVRQNLSATFRCFLLFGLGRVRRFYSPIAKQNSRNYVTTYSRIQHMLIIVSRG